MHHRISSRAPAPVAGRSRVASLLTGAALSLHALAACGGGEAGGDGGTGPAPATGPAQFRVTASAGSARTATQALVAVFYVANGGTPANDLARDLSPEAGGILAARIVSVGELASPVNFTIDLKPCLDDPRRTGAVAGECAAHTVVALLRGTNTLPSERPERVTMPAENVLDVRYAPAVTLRSGGSAAVPEPVAVREVKSVRLTVSDPGMTVGQSLSIGAVALTAHGDTLTGLPVAWSSANGAVARVDANGVVNAVAPGTTTVTADMSGVTSTTTVTVRACALRAVTVFPTSLAMLVGGASSVAATLDAEACITERGIRWRSGNTAVATVNASGLVEAVASGETTIYAMAAADTTVAGTVSVRVTAKPEPSITIRGVTRGGSPVDLTALTDSVDVQIEARPELEMARDVRLLLVPASGTPVPLATYTNVAQATTWSVALPTSALQADGLTPRFRNGAYTLRAELVTSSGGTKSSQANVRFANADYATVAVAGQRQATDAMGQVWHGGAVTVTVTPLDYSGTISGGRVTFSGTRSDGSTIDHSVTYASTGVQQATLPVSGATPSLGFLVVPELRATVTVARSTNVPVSDVRYSVPFVRVDNQPPAAGSYTFDTQGTGNNWIGTGYQFAGGYVAATTPPSGNDNGGVGLGGIAFEVAPISTHLEQVCSPAQSGLTFTPVTSGANLATSPVNGIAPTGPSYCLRLREYDALGNTRLSFMSPTFGADRTAPTIVQILPASTPNQAVFTNPASAGMVTLNLELFDETSGLDATPVNYAVTRWSATGTACVQGSGASCARTDAAQSMTVSGVNRIAMVPWGALVTQSGYYTFSGVVRDVAANSSTAITRQLLVDGTAPVSGTIALPAGIMRGASTVTFFATSLSDDLDLASAEATLVYPAGQFRCGEQLLGTAWDATLTTSIFNATLACPAFMRSLATSSAVAGAKPTAVIARATDAARNVSVPNPSSGAGYRAIIPQDVEGSSLTFAATGLAGFRITNAPSGGVNDYVVVTAEVWGAAGSFANPFAWTRLYHRVAGGDWKPIPGLFSGGVQVEEGGFRYYRQLFTIHNAVFGPAGTSVQIAVIGSTTSGDAIMTAPTSFTVTP